MLKFKEFLQKEERSNPDLNPKISINQRIKDYLDKSRMLSSVKDTKNAFVSFTSLEKLGLNPKSKYNTPLGIYAYPLDYVYDEIGDSSHPSRLPFVGGAPFANLFSVEGRVVDLKNMTRVEFDKWVEILKSKYPDLVDRELVTAVKEAKVKTPGGCFWNLTRLISNNPVNWNTVFQSIGVDGCVDNGYGIIHQHEPTQAVFFNTKCLRHIQRWDNKTVVSGLPLNLKNVSDIATALKNGSITQNQADDAYIFLLSKNIKLLDQIPNPSEPVQLAAVKEASSTIQYIQNPTEKVQLAAVEKNGAVIRFIRNPSEAVQIAAVEVNGSVIRFIQNPSEAVQLAAVQKNELAIQYIQNPSEAVQIAAVEGNGTVIRFIQNPSEKVQLIAVQNDPDALQYIQNPSEAVQLAAVKGNGTVIQYIQNPSEKIQLAVIRNNPKSIKYIQTPSEDIQIIAVQQKATSIQFIKNPSEAVQLAAVQKYVDSIDYIKNPTEKVQMEAVQKDVYAIQFIRNPTEAVQLFAIKKNIGTIYYIRNPTLAVKKLAGVA